MSNPPTPKAAGEGRPHVLIAAVHYRPEVTGGVPRILLLEDFLRRAGWRVSLVTPQPIAEGCHGAAIVRVPPPCYVSLAATVPPGGAPHPESRLHAACKRWARRWLFFPDTYVGWSLRAARQAVRIDRPAPPQLVITSSPQESTHWLGWRLQRALGCRWLADFRDGWTFEPHRAEAAMAVRGRLERRCERWVLEHADWTTAATMPIAADFQSRYRRGPNTSITCPPASRNACRRSRSATTHFSAWSIRAVLACRSRCGGPTCFWPACARRWTPAPLSATNSAWSWWAPIPSESGTCGASRRWPNASRS